MTSCVGNLFYLAPEVFSGDHYTESAGNEPHTQRAYTKRCLCDAICYYFDCMFATTNIETLLASLFCFSVCSSL
jgi:hypothetical protein